MLTLSARRTIVLMLGCIAILVILGTHLITHYSEESGVIRLSPELKADLQRGVGQLAVSPDGQFAFAVMHEENADRVDLKTGGVSLFKLGKDIRGDGVGVTRDGLALVVAGKSGDRDLVQICDLNFRSLRPSINVNSGMRLPFVLDSDGTHLYAGSTLGNRGVNRIGIKNASVEEFLGPGSRTDTTIDWNSDIVKPLAISPDGNEIIVGAWRRAMVWNIHTSRERLSCMLSTIHSCMFAAVSPDGRHMATAGATVEVWDFHTGSRLRELAFAPDLGGTTGLAFSPDGKLLVQGISEGVHFPSYLIVWRTNDYSQHVVIRVHSEAMHAMCFLPSTHQVITGSDDQTVCVWDLDKLQWDR